MPHYIACTSKIPYTHMFVSPTRSLSFSIDPVTVLPTCTILVVKACLTLTLTRVRCLMWSPLRAIPSENSALMYGGLAPRRFAPLPFAPLPLLKLKQWPLRG